MGASQQRSFMRAESKAPVLLLVPSGGCAGVPKLNNLETKYL